MGAFFFLLLNSFPLIFEAYSWVGMMKTAVTQLKRFGADEAGATAIEYALIGSLLSIVIIGAVVALNGSLTDVYRRIESYIVPALEGTPMPDEG